MPKLYRINDILQQRGISLNSFAQAIGMSPSGIKQMIKRNSTRIQTLELIAKALNCPIDYFFDNNNLQETHKSSSSLKEVPHIPYSAQAGSLSGFSDDAISGNCLFYPQIEFLGSYDFTIDIQGDSMLPAYEDGDTIACKRIQQIGDLRDNQIYVLDTAQGILIKKVEKSASTPEHISCISLNTSYEPFEVALSEVYGISEVIAVVKKQ